jgi:hypothetical protein
MGQLDSTCRAPPRLQVPLGDATREMNEHLVVVSGAVHTLKSKNLRKPVFLLCTTVEAHSSAWFNRVQQPSPHTPHLVVALQVAFERQTLKPVFHLIGYRLWVRKAIGYGLWVNLIQRAPPHLVVIPERLDKLDADVDGEDSLQRPVERKPRRSAAGCVLERQTLKPAYHLIGYRLWV